MNIAVVVQNQALYLTTLYKRKEVWEEVRDSSVLLLRHAKASQKGSFLKPQEITAIQASVSILESEIKQLDKMHEIDSNI